MEKTYKGLFIADAIIMILWMLLAVASLYFHDYYVAALQFIIAVYMGICHMNRTNVHEWRGIAKRGMVLIEEQNKIIAELLLKQK